MCLLCESAEQSQSVSGGSEKMMVVVSFLFFFLSRLSFHSGKESCSVSAVSLLESSRSLSVGK